MAMNPPNIGHAASRRWFFGTNVTVMVAAAAFLLVAVNWIGHRHNARKDLAGGFSSHRLSQRTKQILDKLDGDLRITTVYTSDVPESDWRRYLPTLQDLCEELRQYSRRIEVHHVRSGEERARLVKRVQSKFGSGAEAYDKVANQAMETWTQVEAALQPRREAIGQILSGKGWLADFTTLADRMTVIRKDLENIEETRKEVNRLIRGEGIPRYQEANNRIKSANEDLKRHIEALQDWMRLTEGLVQALGSPDAEFVRTTREKLQEMAALTLRLRQVAGEVNDPSVPEDPAPVLQEYAKAAAKLSSWLNDEFGRASAFAKAHPTLRHHPDWQVQEQIFVMDLPVIPAQVSESLAGNAQQLRQILQARDVPRDQLQNVVRQLREFSARYQERLDEYARRMLRIFEACAGLSDAERQFLAAGASGEAFKDVLDRLSGLADEIGKLPELKLDEIAESLQQDNIVVVESDAKNEVRVVSFDQVWPVADPSVRQFVREKEGEGPRRVFDGDSAISAAILGMVTTKPLATVILVGFETQPPPQMRQFQRPSTGPIPLGQLTVLTEKLKAARFAVKQWNLGGSGEDGGEDPPAPEEGTEPIYVVLPPADTPPVNPMMPQAPQETFGEAQLARLRKAMGPSGKALFLAVADVMPRQPWSPQASYGYHQMLRDEWGIDVKFNNRVIRGVRDTQDPDAFGIDILQWTFMPLSSFTDQPIGAPLKARRLLMAEVCPVVPAEKVPDGVTIEPVLEVPTTARDMWATDDITDIIMAVSEGRQDSTFRVPANAMRPPFPVILAARKAAPAPATAPGTQPAEVGQAESRVVVMGVGLSFIDGYLSRRVPRLEGKTRTRLATDPPPTENVDLMVNALYWLTGRPDMIAAGPAPVPLIGEIRPAQQQRVWMLAAGWAFAVLIAGGVVMMVRRK